MGDYKSAEYYSKQALEIKKIVLGEEHPSYASSLNNLGLLYQAMGDYKSAEPFLKQALVVKKKALGEDHPDYASSLNNLGVLYKEMGDYKSAEYYSKQALEIKKIVLGEEHPSYASSLNNLGVLYKEMGDYKSAETYLKQAMEIRKKVLSEDHPAYASSLSNLGVLYKSMGNYNATESNYKQALAIRKKILGENHPDYISTENSYAFILTSTSRENQAYEILNKNFKKKAVEIANNFEWLNESQKEAYWKKESSFYDNLSWFANEVFEKVPAAVGLNYNSALVSKSKLLEAKISSENYYREVDELREELSYRRKLLSKLESDGTTDKKRLEMLSNEADSLDKLLTLSWPEYAQQKKNLSITWDQVQQNLDNGEVAIEFVRFKNENDSLYYYNALVLKKGDVNPTLIKLCKEKDLLSINPKMGFSAYYTLIWQPLESSLNDIKTIYYAPVGELYNIPFQAIYSPKGKGDEILAANTDKRGVSIQNESAISEKNAEYLMDRYTLHQLTSTRYLAMGLKPKAKEPIGNTLVMVGGVNYDYLPGSTSKNKPIKIEKSTKRSSTSAAERLIYLEGTKEEVEQINEKVSASNWQSKIIENNDALEEKVIQLEGKQAVGILHFATHGYSFPEFDFNDSTINPKSLRYSYRYSNNPMVRSGLILTGGNWAWIGSDTLSKLGAEQNGILTALEVSQLNLRKTKLVVLSACETGLGKIEGSEGMFGLKRGFKLAGVEQMIVSLWSVPDKETMELMTLFYSDLVNTSNPVISFEKAQKEMRNKYPTEPEKWAGFVLVR
jgi:CHAT domain-containing protein/Tfp pilus assembly protein PilF